MKKIQKYRLIIQSICLILTIVSFFINFKLTTLILMASTFLFGVFFCGWICPYGFIQDLSSKLGKFLGIKSRKMPLKLQKFLVFSRYILFGLVLIIQTSLVFSIMSFDPRVNFEKLLLGNIPTIASLIIIMFFLLISLFFDRPFCNYLCYEGAKYGLMSSIRLFTIKRDSSTCINCKKCDNVCPMNIEVSKSNNLRSLQCINCLQCVSSCPLKNTLNYGKCNMNKNKKKKYFAITTVILILVGCFMLYNTNNTKNNSNIEKTQNIQSTNTDSLNEVKDGEIITGEEAKKLGDATGISDGTYAGESQGYRGTMTVQVTIKNEYIVKIEVLDHMDDRKWFNRAYGSIPNKIIETQSTNVDVVSGATYSSIGIKNGVKDALEKAK